MNKKSKLILAYFFFPLFIHGYINHFYGKYRFLLYELLQFLGISSIIFIIEDFNAGPSSDLAKFSGILPEVVWMYVWLIIVIIITGWNLRLIFKK